MRLVMVYLCISVAIGGALACDEKIDPMVDMEEEALVVTYSMQIKLILDEKCISCHAAALTGEARNGATEGVNLDTYPAASSVALGSNSRIQVDRMPPGGPLTPAEKNLFQQWVDNGMPE